MKRKILAGLLLVVLAFSIVGCNTTPEPQQTVGENNLEEKQDKIDSEKKLEKKNKKDAFDKEKEEKLEKKDIKPKNSEKKETVTTETNMETTFQLFDMLESDENLMISPLSLNLAIGMVANGAEGETLSQIEDYLGMSVDEFNEYSEYYTEDTDELKIANAIWCSDEEGYEVSDDFKKLLITYYDADTQVVDFEDKNILTLINNWCKKETQNLITNILDRIEPDTEMILTNALYFNADWENPFDESAVREEDFTNLDNSVVTVEMMNGEESTYYENENAIGFSKDYADGNYTFIAILPKDEGDFNLSDLDIESFLASESSETVYFKLPKFTTESSVELQDILKALGVERAFSEDAEFGRMLESQNPVMLSRVIQKTYIDVNETGTEAAAVTAITVLRNTAYVPEEPKEVYLDRPFAYIIMDNNTNTPLFVGKIVNF